MGKMERSVSFKALPRTDFHLKPYPRQLTYTLAGLKLICGCCLVVLGILAMHTKASYNTTYAGFWTGFIVIISAVFAFFSVKHNAARNYVLAFFAASFISMLASVLVIIYSATGLALDTGYPSGFVIDPSGTGRKIPVSQINLIMRQGALLVNLILIILGILDIIFNLTCFIICLREICECYTSSNTDGHSSLHKDWRLHSWAGQQANMFYSNMSGFPYAPSYLPLINKSSPPFMYLPSETSLSSHGRHKSHSPSRRYPQPNVFFSSSSPYQPLSFLYDLYHSPPSSCIYPLPYLPSSSQYIPIHPSWMYGESCPIYYEAPSNKYDYWRRPHSAGHRVLKSNRSHSVRGPNSGGTVESELDKGSFAGHNHDRELAEEYFVQTMETKHANDRRSVAIDDDAW